MTDQVSNQIDQMIMASNTQGSNVKVSGSRDGGDLEVTLLTTAESHRVTTGDVTVPFTAAQAEEEHRKIQGIIDGHQARLSEQTFDKTGKASYVLPEGSRERALASMELQSAHNNLAFWMKHAAAKLSAAAAAPTQDDSLREEAQHALNVSALAEEIDATTGRPMGRVRADSLLREAALKSKAAALVRGGN
jgi:hypothetical protein